MSLPAHKLRPGTVIKWNNGLYKVNEIEFRGTGKSAKMIQSKLHDIEKNLNLEHRFDGEERLEDVELQRAKYQYLYADGDMYYFMDQISFEQVGVTADLLGNAIKFIKPDTVIDAELYEGRIVNVDLPEFLEVTVSSAPAGSSESGNNTFKEVTLDNGQKILAPQFIKSGDLIRVDWAHLKYVDRVLKDK